MPIKPLSSRLKTLTATVRLLSSSPSSSSRLRDYGFAPPASLAPSPQPRRPPKPRHRPPSSLDRGGRQPLHSDLPFDFRFSYTESNPSVRPIGLREPKYSPFGPGRIDRAWTGLSAPALRSADGDDEETRRAKAAKAREAVLGDPLTPAEQRFLVENAQKHQTKRQINLGRDGLTHNMLNDIHNNWKHAEAVRVKCMGVPTVDMENVCTQLEDKSGGLIIHRKGGQIILYRGRHYDPRRRPVIPLMLWKPREPVYPKLTRTVVQGLSIEETKELRKKGLAAPTLTKLAKNGYYGNLLTMVRDAFLIDELVRIDCKGLGKSDYRKIGYKLAYLVPCVIVTFEKEQIVIWRGKDDADRQKSMQALIASICDTDFDSPLSQDGVLAISEDPLKLNDESEMPARYPGQDAVGTTEQ